jgi:ATP-binding cassette subfamily F protein 3
MITLKNVTLRRGTKVLLDSVSVTINPGEKVGLVGATARANPPCLPAQRHAARRRRRLLHARNGAWPRWRRTCPRPTKAPPISCWRRHPPGWNCSELPAAEKPRRRRDGMAIAHAYTDLHDAGAHDAVPARRR